LNLRTHCSLLFFSILFVSVSILASATKDQSTANNAPQLLWKATPNPCALTEPVVGGESVFVGTCEGKFYAIANDRGSVFWSHDSRAEGASGGFQATPLLRKDLVIAGTFDGCNATTGGYVFGFDQHTGKLRWKLQAGIGSVAFVEIDDANVFFGTPQGEWLSVEPNSGKVNWRFRATPPGTNCEKRISAVTDGMHVCLMAYDGTVHCLDAKSGRELWKQNPSSPLTTRVFMYKDVLYFGTADGHIYGFNPENGQPLVQLKLDYVPVGDFVWSHEGAKGEFEFVYATDKNKDSGAVLGFSDEFEAVIWDRTFIAHGTSEHPAPWKGRLFAADCKGDIVAYSASTGVPEWKGHVEGCVKAFNHSRSTLYVAVAEGAIYTFKFQ